MKISKINIFLSVILVLFLFLLIYSASSYMVLNENLKEIQTIQAKAGIGEEVGIIVGEEYLEFGSIPSGGSSAKTINYTAQSDSYIVITSTGSISKLLSTNQNKIYVYEGLSERISFIANSEGIQRGNYNGTVYFYTFKEEPGWLEKQILQGDIIPRTDELSSQPGVNINISDTDSNI